MPVKKNQYRHFQMKKIATDYLANISLNENADSLSKANYFEKCLSNEFDCFLYLNEIDAPYCDDARRSEFLQYYRAKLKEDRVVSSRLDSFLKTEFNDIPISAEELKVYIQNLMNSSKQKTHRNVVTFCDSKCSNIDCQANKSSEQRLINDSNEAEPNVLETEATDCRRKCSAGNQTKRFDTSNVLALANSSSTSLQVNNPSKQTLNSTLASLANAQHKRSRFSKSPKESEVVVIQKGTSGTSAVNSHSDHVTVKQDSTTAAGSVNPRNHAKLLRSASESSNDSTFGTVNSTNTSVRNMGSSFITSNNKIAVQAKPNLYRNLKKMMNEKLLLTSNSSPVCILSRLPFKVPFPKVDMNESFHVSKSRQMSVSKIIYSHNNFLFDVLDLLSMEYDDYLKTGIKSYENFIDPSVQALNSNPAQSTNEYLIEFPEDNNFGTNEFINNALKKDNSPNILLCNYQPDYLDDPQLTELTAGKNRTCLKFASYAVSIIDYVKPLDFKKEINETFKEKFPYIQISLTKLRSIKREMLEISCEISLDTIIVAQSYIYFEKLILRGLINKNNRKYLAANCLLIAAKLNDVTKRELSKLVDAIIDKFRFDNKKDLISYEFAILVALQFNLMIKYEHQFLSHFERIKYACGRLKYPDAGKIKLNFHPTKLFID